jgi:hypothetical protein
MSRASRSRRRSLDHALSPRAAPAIVTVVVILLACAEAAASPEDLPAPIARVRLSLDSTVLMKGETLQLSVTDSDSAGDLPTGRDVLLYSMNSKVASVAPDGSVYARSYGRAMIVARAEGVRDTAWIDVGTVSDRQCRCCPHVRHQRDRQHLLLGRGIDGAARLGC